jgi:peroxiredoxin
MPEDPLQPGDRAPDFEIKDTQGRTVRLSGYRGEAAVLVVLLRGFA